MAAPRKAAAAALEVATAVPRDVVLFRHEADGFFRLAGLFCVGQSVFWTYLAHFAYTGLRPPAPEAASGPDDPLRPRDNKWRYGFSASCLTLASLLLAGGTLFPLRCLRRVTLHGGGGRVTLSTQRALGLGPAATLSVPLGHVSCGARRARGPLPPPFLPIKVKGRPFFFLLDQARGQLSHPRLFDLTVGAYRKI